MIPTRVRVSHARLMSVSQLINKKDHSYRGRVIAENESRSTADFIPDGKGTAA